MRRGVVAFALVFAGSWPLAAGPAGEVAAQRVLAAYPATLDRIDGNVLITKSGARIVIDDGKIGKTNLQRLDDADIKDMFADPYPPAAPLTQPALNADPGRARSRALFDAMYGDCAKGQVSPNLVDVPWLPTRGGGTIKVTHINGVADKLAAVSRQLDTLPRELTRYLVPAAGGYNCRAVAGTSRASAHSWGIAVDIAVSTGDYWRWGRSPAPAEGSAGIGYRNRVPAEIIAVFEAHGFIWGGRWYHYDTLHFEYRPELLPRR
jgi:hypothetical protein